MDHDFQLRVMDTVISLGNKFVQVQRQLATLTKQVERFSKIMADLNQAEADLATSVNNLVTQDKGLQAQVATLQSQLAAGNVAAATETANAIEAVVAQINAQVVPLVPDPAAGGNTPAPAPAPGNGPVIGPASAKRKGSKK